MTIRNGETGQKNLQKVSPKKGLMQHFNKSCVLVLRGGGFYYRKTDGNRIKTGQLYPEFFDYRFDY
jgi:hypothetical protein